MVTAEQMMQAEAEGRAEARAQRWTKRRAEEHGLAEYRRGLEEAREGQWLGAVVLAVLGVLAGLAAGATLF